MKRLWLTLCLVAIPAIIGYNTGGKYGVPVVEKHYVEVPCIEGYFSHHREAYRNGEWVVVRDGPLFHLVSLDTVKVFDSPCCGDTSIIVTVWSDSTLVVETCKTKKVKK